MPEKERIRAIGLLSGGLDSQLAVCVVRDQGIGIHGVVFESPFFDSVQAKEAGEQLGIPVTVVDFSGDISSILADPPHGFGSCMNPCIDCHARMLRRAGEMMEDMGYHFLFTGEVLGERPMSQSPSGLRTVTKESGYGDVIVRPLSARLLPATKPEREGWLDRSKLLSLEGRGRKRQLQLASHYGLSDFPSPSGGCRLTEPNFSRRLSDLKEHEGLDGTRSIYLLRLGRHFRLTGDLKVIVGRDEKENVALEGCAELYDLVLKMEDVPGPTALLPIRATEGQRMQAAAICARYADCPEDRPVTVRVRSSRGMTRLGVVPALREDAEALRV